MGLHGTIPPPTGTPPLPGDPFAQHPNAGIHVELASGSHPDGKGKYITRVIPDENNLNNIQNFDSGAVGSPSAEQIWAFKMRQLAADVDLCVGLIQNMIDTVPPGRDAWAAGAAQVQTDLLALQKACGLVCEKTANPKPNP